MKSPFGLALLMFVIRHFKRISISLARHPCAYPVVTTDVPGVHDIVMTAIQDICILGDKDNKT
jgi:hypothetical protein